MIFNPWGWSSVVNFSVNISLISALLICLVLYELSTEKLGWEIWHRWMKGNAEAAINIRRQRERRRERGPEGTNGEICSSLRKFLNIPVVRIVLTVLLGLWPAGTI